MDTNEDDKSLKKERAKFASELLAKQNEDAVKLLVTQNEDAVQLLAKQNKTL